MIRKSINLLLLSLTACTVSPGDDVGSVQQLVAERALERENCSLDSLDAEGAVYFAIERNPEIQGRLQEVRLAQGDWVAASEISNPAFEFMFRFTNESKFYNNFEYAIVQNLVDICLRPIKMESAQAGLEGKKWMAAHEILELAFDAEEAFYRLKAEELIQGYRREEQELLRAKALLAEEKVKAGSISTFEEKESQASANQAQAAFLEGGIALSELKKTFEVLIGNPCSYALVEDLPQPLEDTDLCEAESYALAQRADLQAMRWDLYRVRKLRPGTSIWVYTNFAAGLSQERESEGDQVIGPVVSGEIPLFNYGASDRLKLNAEIAWLETQILSLEQKIAVAVRNDVRALELQLEKYHLYAQRQLPLLEKRVQEAQEFYNAMVIDAEQLIQVQYELLENRIASIEALRDYWLARVNLKRVVGGVL